MAAAGLDRAGGSLAAVWRDRQTAGGTRSAEPQVRARRLGLSNEQGAALHRGGEGQVELKLRD